MDTASAPRLADALHGDGRIGVLHVDDDERFAERASSFIEQSDADGARFEVTGVAHLGRE